MKDTISVKTIEMVQDIFQQGDERYNDYQSAIDVAEFIDNNAIIVEKKEIDAVKIPKKEIDEINGPQQYYKALAKRVSDKKGYRFIGYEKNFPGGIVDVLAEDTSGNKIAIECCSCRISKAISYLEEENTILWILSISDKPIEVTKYPLFIIKRGPNWDAVYKRYNGWRINLIKNVKSPRD